MQWAVLVLGLSCVVSGTVLLRQRWSWSAGWLLLMSGAVGSVAWWLRGAEGAHGLVAVLFVICVLILAPAACWAFPTPRWRTSMDAVLGISVVGPGVAALINAGDANYVGTLAFVAGAALLVQTWWRLEHSTGWERRSLIWFGLATGTSGFLSLGLLFLSDTTSTAFESLGVGLLAVIPAAMAWGASRPEVVDVRDLVAYAVRFAVASAAFVAYYVLAYAILSKVAGEPPASGVQAVVALVGAAALRPGSVVLRGVVDRLLFGDRPDSLSAATRALDRFGTDPETALDAVRESLALPHARLSMDEQIVGTSGTLGARLHSIPLSLSDGTAGELVVGLRPGDLHLRREDEQVLRLVGPLLAQSVRARALAADLRESRGRAIATIEEERRRLRRDLHDGLGPTLTGIGFSAQAARNSIRADPDTADALLEALRSDAAEALETIRRLVHGMRPPALDELGLELALRQQALTLRTRTGGLLTVDFEVPDEIPPLAAAVEVAAYRIVMESLSNVARHSTGTAAKVHLRAEADRLFLEVTDDGSPAKSWHAGVGLASMRERAAEVGGELNRGPTPSGGRVGAVLPLL